MKYIMAFWIAVKVFWELCKPQHTEIPLATLDVMEHFSARYPE